MEIYNFSKEQFAVIMPKFIERANTDWVLYGEDNLYPNKLIDLANKSALHNAINMSKINNVVGNGFMTDNLDTKTIAFMENPNPNETFDDIFRKIVYDYVIFGGYCLNIIWSRDRKTIAEIYHIDFSRVRSGKSDERELVKTYYYSKNWAQYRKQEFAPVTFDAFGIAVNNKGEKYFLTNKDWNTDKRKELTPSQLLYVKEYRSGLEYYPLPSYIAALGYIETDSEISNFHLSHIKNGMAPSMMITFNNGIPSEEERRIIEEKIKSKYIGSDNAGKFILNYADDSTKAPTVTTLTPAQLDKQFIQLQATVLQNILSGHQVVSPLLVGIPTPGSLSNASEMLNAYQLYINTVIQPIKDILMRSVDMIFSINGLTTPEIATSSPVEFTLSENVMAQILTKDELRSLIGYEPLTPEISTQPTE